MLNILQVTRKNKPVLPVCKKEFFRDEGSEQTLLK